MATYDITIRHLMRCCNGIRGDFIPAVRLHISRARVIVGNLRQGLLVTRSAELRACAYRGCARRKTLTPCASHYIATPDAIVESLIEYQILVGRVVCLQGVYLASIELHILEVEEHRLVVPIAHRESQPTGVVVWCNHQIEIAIGGCCEWCIVATIGAVESHKVHTLGHLADSIRSHLGNLTRQVVLLLRLDTHRDDVGLATQTQTHHSKAIVED